MRLKIFITVVFLGFSILTEVRAQSTLNYAWSTNGETGTKLFPEVGNNVIISNTIDTDCSPEDIIAAAETLIVGVGIEEGKKIAKIAHTSRRIVYECEFSFGHQNWGMEFWGSSLFNVNKDATKVKFKLDVEAINGKYKYSFTNFETNRNTLKGEAKNDGQPNTIHWQRVNSLKKERDRYANSHSYNRKTKEVLYDYDAQINYENYLYGNEYHMIDVLAKSLDKISCGEAGFSDMVSTGGNNTQEILNPMSMCNFTAGVNGIYNMTFEPKPDQIPELVSIHKAKDPSFLLAKGNNVYVSSGDYTYEMAGAQELIKQISIDNFWNVVYDINEADFVIDYHVNLEGRDKGYIDILNPSQTISVSKYHRPASESVGENREVARSIYLEGLVKIQKNFENNKYMSEFAKFYNQEYE